MASELFAPNQTVDVTMYAVVRKGVQAWNATTSAWSAYSTTRGYFDYQPQTVDVNGDYGPYDLPGEGPGRRWQICQQVGASPAHSDIVVREGSENELTALAEAKVDGIKTRTDLALPAIAPAASGGLPTVDASNRVAGIVGTVATFDTLLAGAETLDEAMPQVLVATTIESLGSQTLIVIPAADAATNNDAYTGATAVLTNVAGTQRAHVVVADYIAATRTIMLDVDPTFTIAIGDAIRVMVAGTASVDSSADIALIKNQTDKMEFSAFGDTNFIYARIEDTFLAYGQPTTIATVVTPGLAFTLTEVIDYPLSAYDGAYADMTIQVGFTSALLGARRIASYVAATGVFTLAESLSGIAVGMDAVVMKPMSVGGGEGGTALSDPHQEPVPGSRTWRLIYTAAGLVGDKTRTLYDGASETFAVDFAVDLPTNGRVITASSFAIVTGTAGGVTFGTPGRDRSQAKCRLTGVTAGTYTIRCSVVYDSGVTAQAVVTLEVI